MKYDLPTPDERFAANHTDCEPPWRCLGCESLVCPRCEPSPAEEELCAECYWKGGEAA